MARPKSRRGAFVLCLANRARTDFARAIDRREWAVHSSGTARAATSQPSPAFIRACRQFRCGAHLATHLSRLIGAQAEPEPLAARITEILWLPPPPLAFLGCRRGSPAVAQSRHFDANTNSWQLQHQQITAAQKPVVIQVALVAETTAASQSGRSDWRSGHHCSKRQPERTGNWPARQITRRQDWRPWYRPSAGE